jgi:polyribonucleotide nucleotidyltransferase
MLDAIAFGHAECKKIVRAQRELVQRAGKPRWTVAPPRATPS